MWVSASHRVHAPYRVGGDWGWGCGGEKAHAPDWRARKLRLGPRRGEGALHPGRVRQSSSWLPELLEVEERTKRRCSRVRTFMEHLRAGTVHSAGHPPYRTAGSLSSADWENSAPPHSPQSAGTSNLNKRPPPPACVRAAIRH